MESDSEVKDLPKLGAIGALDERAQFMITFTLAPRSGDVVYIPVEAADTYR